MKYFFNLLATIVAITVIVHISILKLRLGNTYFIILSVAFVPLLMTGKEWKLNSLMIWLVFASIISIVLNDIPAFFRPYERFIAFLLVVGLIGPLVRSTKLESFRGKLFDTINFILVTMVVISFLGIILKLPIMVGRGGFTGLFNHSMTLGPMAAIAMLVTINWAQQTENRKKHWIYLSIAALAFITCVAAGSRIALLAGFAGALFYYYKINQGRLTKYIRIVMVIAAIGIFSFPLWQSYTDRMMGKMAYAEQKGDLLVTRLNMWETRIREFKSSPLLGVGFASTITNINTKVDKIEGRVEPGSSWLAILSMIGILGFIPVFLLTLQYLLYLFKDKTNPQNAAFLGGYLSLFITHMMAEGYVLSAGSGLFFYFWLLMGIIEQNKKQIIKQ